MQNYWFLYNTSTGNIAQPYLGDADQWLNIPSGQGVIGPLPQTTASTSVQDAYNNPSHYIVQNGQLLPQSYFTLSSTPVSSTPNAFTITATLNNVPATPPSQCTFTIASTPIVKTLTSNQSSIIVQLHKVVANQIMPIQVSASGCVSGSVNIGGTSSTSSNIKSVMQGDGSVLIKNTSKQEITNYYMSHTVSQSDILTDLANLADFYADMLNKLMNWAQAASFAPINLTLDEKNAITDFGNNYIPKLRLKLDNATPVVSATPANFRYPNILTHKQQANTTADEYLQVISDPDVH